MRRQRGWWTSGCGPHRAYAAATEPRSIITLHTPAHDELWQQSASYERVSDLMRPPLRVLAVGHACLHAPSS